MQVGKALLYLTDTLNAAHLDVLDDTQHLGLRCDEPREIDPVPVPDGRAGLQSLAHDFDRGTGYVLETLDERVAEELMDRQLVVVNSLTERGGLDLSTLIGVDLGGHPSDTP